jgi:hypothetical protein
VGDSDDVLSCRNSFAEYAVGAGGPFYDRGGCSRFHDHESARCGKAGRIPCQDAELFVSPKRDGEERNETSARQASLHREASDGRVTAVVRTLLGEVSKGRIKMGFRQHFTQCPSPFPSHFPVTGLAVPPGPDKLPESSLEAIDTLLLI